MAENTVEIYRYDDGATKVFIDARIDDEGRLVLEGQDLGEGPLQFWGDDEYEYWVVSA